MKRIILLILCMGLCHMSQAQLINKIEYFVDTDPGFGNATDVPMTPDSVLNGFMFNADVSLLTPGMHTLFVRSKNDQGKWSLTQYQYLYKFPPLINNNVLPTVDKLEYFIDTDPGFGNATNVPFLAGTSINGLPINTLVSNLSTGMHTLYIRSLDATGRWSLTQSQYLYKFPPLINNNLAPSITKLEYFIDSDPGFGNGTNVPITADSVITNFSFNANVSSLSAGLHTLYIRSLDASGRWSLTQSQYLYKFPPLINNNLAPSITKLEYFIDSDPGFGNGTNVPITADSVITNFSFNANVSSLSAGLHTLYIRSLDASGRWSLTQNQYLYKFPTLINNNVAPSITKLEYFVDSDPGFGNGTNVPITADSLITNFSFNANVSSLSAGLHSLYIRSLDATGRWSLTQNQYLYKFPALINNNVAPSITKLEYFVDSDPGFGNGTNVPITADSVLSAIGFTVDVDNLNYGTHMLYVRSMNANGKWSLTRNSKFTRDKIKFFIQGYYAGGGLMNPVLDNQGIGTNLLMTDTVTVELHNPTYPYALKETSKGILYTNGELRCSFVNAVGSFYIVVKHRNSIETWSNAPVVIGTNIMTFDFSTAANKGYGNNLIQVDPLVWAIYNGDINQDDYVDGSDYPMFDLDSQNNVQSEYAATDMNGDGYVDGSDYPIFDANSQNNVQILKP